MLSFLLGLLWDGHNTVTPLPAPTDPYAVGRTIYTWGAASRASSSPQQLIPFIPSSIFI